MKKPIAICAGLLILASGVVSAQDEGLVGALAATTGGLTDGLDNVLLGLNTDAGLLGLDAGLGATGLIAELEPALPLAGGEGGSLLGGVAGTAGELGGIIDATVSQLPVAGDGLVLPGLSDPAPDALIPELLPGQNRLSLPGLDALPLSGLAGDWPTTRLPGVETLPLPGLDALPIPVR